MHCTSHKLFACLCLPQRLKPQTAASVAVFPFSRSISFPQIFRNILVVSYTIYLQCLKDPNFYRAKNRVYLGLLALFFCSYLADNYIREEIL